MCHPTYFSVNLRFKKRRVVCYFPLNVEDWYYPEKTLCSLQYYYSGYEGLK